MAKMKLKPLGNHVIIKPIKEEKTTKAGIVLPDTAEEEKPERGKVVAVGPGKILGNGQRYAFQVKVGDQVIFKKYSPDEIKIEDEEYLILDEDDILAIIE